jgi:hypothetical protein
MPFYLQSMLIIAFQRYVTIFDVLDSREFVLIRRENSVQPQTLIV